MNIQTPQWLQKRRALPLLVLVGIVLATLLISTKKTPPREVQNNLAKPVSIIAIQQQTIRPMITGYGEVEPDILLSAKAEVGGRITYVHPELRKGALLPKGSLVVTIDAKDHQLALSQAKADLASSEASLKEYALNLKDAELDLKLAREKLVLAQRELSRIAKLLKKKAISQTNYDNQKSIELQLKQEVQNLSNRVEILPAQLEIAEAKREIAQANVEIQQRNLARTEIRLPFNARINELNVEQDQFVAQGNALFSAQNTDKILINAQFSPAQFKIIARSFAPFQGEIKQAMINQTMIDLLKRVGLRASVQLTDMPEAIWQGKVERISNEQDPDTRTLGITISVDKPYEKIEPGVKPPLINGMYTRIKLYGSPESFYLAPRSALHEGQLYLVDHHDQLERRIIVPFHQQGELALFKEGLKTDEKLIVSDLHPAVPGMKLQPRINPQLQQSIQHWAEEIAQ